ncbi:uncharacterized protein LOC105781384 [Gossypium raimondii]|uniref:uncharacterized protein LOC105781384 n=1 Tax=Gossypium raimondii TaxID=29730 RepID=UPI00063AE101|nr:uncharacterized protein LOC105781384 [Gossypium raimondii]
MIAKSRGEEEDVGNLKKLFKRLRKFQLKLNPAKCTFGATSGKLLGFIVSDRVLSSKAQTIHVVSYNMVNFKARSIKVLDGITRTLRENGTWQILLSEYDIVYVSQKSIKGRAIADFLASRAMEEYESLRFDFPDKDLMCISEGESSKDQSWKMSFDGASNTLGHGIGAVLLSQEGNHYPLTARLNFFCTNNIAEYEACIMGLRAAIEWKIEILELVNALTTLASIFKANRETEIIPLQMSIYEVLAHCFSIEKESDGRPWFHDILEYIKNQRYPKQVIENNKRTIRRIVVGFVIDGDILYKRGMNQMLLRCMDAIEARKILEEIHEGICKTHANGFTMARQIMRLGLISPKASNGHRFVSVVIDYFTKWVEATSFANVTKTAIKHQNSSPYLSKMNGVVEAANKNIKRIIEKMTETYKDWHKKLPFALYAYRTSVRTSTGATPFSLIYRMEAVLPIEVEIPSL